MIKPLLPPSNKERLIVNLDQFLTIAHQVDT